jgi:hypothetical protein
MWKQRAAGRSAETMMYQLGWTTLPGLRGLSVSDFRAERTATPDQEKGVAVDIRGAAECDDFLRRLEEYFSLRRFSNAADAFDSVRAYALELENRQG